MIYWFTGQPGAGKTVLSKALREYLEINHHKNVMHVDGDDIREIFDKKLGNQIKELYVHTTEIRWREQFHSPDYEPPTTNFTDIDTTNCSVTECINKIL